MNRALISSLLLAWLCASPDVATAAEKKAFDSMPNVTLRGFSSIVGHLKEAQFPFAVALAALAVHNAAAYPPFDQDTEKPFGGDIDASLAATDAFTDRTTEALKKFQARHGLSLTGTVGNLTLKAMNVPIEARLRALTASLERLKNNGFVFANRYVVVNIPGAVAEAVEPRSRRLERVGIAVEAEHPQIGARVEDRLGVATTAERGVEHDTARYRPERVDDLVAHHRRVLEVADAHAPSTSPCSSSSSFQTRPGCVTPSSTRTVR